MIINLLTNVIIWVYDCIKFITSKPDYLIIDQSLEYKIDNNIIPEELDGFWEDECIDEWDGNTEMFYKNLTNIDYKNINVPNNVTKVILRIKYWYNDKMYKFLTNDLNHEWPPKQANGIVFNMPIVSAQLLDSDDKPIKDVLNKIKRYAGPRGDFYDDKTTKIHDMLYYDDETLKFDYPTIKLKSALGMIKRVNTENGCIIDLRIP